MKEYELFEPIKNHYLRLGYKIYIEVPLGLGGFRMIDIVLAKGDERMAIETKTSFTKGLYRQAMDARIRFPFVYVAIPTRPRGKTIAKCEQVGVGILQIKDNALIELVKPKRAEYCHTTIFDLSDIPEWTDGFPGVPQQKGVSAAFDVLERIKEYVKNNPDSDWISIWKNVPNHYSSSRSMVCSMTTKKHFSLRDYKKELINE